MLLAALALIVLAFLLGRLLQFGSAPAFRLTWCLGPTETEKEVRMLAFARQKFPLSPIIRYNEQVLGPADVDGAPRWSVTGGTTNASVDVAPDGWSAVCHTGSANGGATVEFAVDVRKGPQVMEVRGSLDLQVVAAEGFIVEMRAGEVVDEDAGPSEEPTEENTKPV